MRVQDNSEHHQNCGRVLLAKIRTKIRYGTIDENSGCRATIFTWVAFAAACVPMWIGGSVNGCHHLLAKSNMSNGTPSELPNQCHFSYETCLCDTLPNITHISKNCITRLEPHSSRILPPISYVMQVLVVRELFTLSAECDRSSLHMAWTASSLILIGIIIGMYWSNCAYSIIMFCIFATSSLLGFTFIYDCQRERAPRNRDAPGDII